MSLFCQGFSLRTFWGLLAIFEVAIFLQLGDWQINNPLDTRENRANDIEVF
jgi:hypothetical protein